MTQNHPIRLAPQNSAHQNIINSFANLAAIAYDIPMRYFRKNLQTQIKTDKSPVTQADLETEKTMRNTIMKTHPQHGILGEEYPDHNPHSPYRWILDPIDGTKSFICGMPLFGTLAGLEHNKKSIYGMITMPALQQTLFAINDNRQNGAWLDGEKIKTDDTIQVLAKARFSIGEADKFCALYPHAVTILTQKLGMLRFYHDCYPFALLASGTLHGVIDSGLKPYDILPIIPVIQAAGGKITDWHGHVPHENWDGSVIATANETLHAQALELIAEATQS